MLNIITFESHTSKHENSWFDKLAFVEDISKSRGYVYDFLVATRVALAKQIGMATKSLHNLEMGFRKFDAYELYTLSRILKKPMYYLLNKPRLSVEDIKLEV